MRAARGMRAKPEAPIHQEISYVSQGDNFAFAKNRSVPAVPAGNGPVRRQRGFYARFHGPCKAQTPPARTVRPSAAGYLGRLPFVRMGEPLHRLDPAASGTVPEAAISILAPHPPNLTSPQKKSAPSRPRAVSAIVVAMDNHTARLA